MKMRRIVTGILLVCVITSCLSGCGGLFPSKKPKLTVETIPVKTEADAQMGENRSFGWKELGYLDNYPEFREIFDVVAGNDVGETQKIGPCYTNAERRPVNNSCLRYAFQNKAFLDDVWFGLEARRVLKRAVKGVYAETDEDVAWLNAYFNIFDTPEGYFNGEQVLSRAEFLTGVYKAHNPVGELEENPKLGTDVNAPFVNQMLPYSYLDLEKETKAYDGVMTRAEAIYTLMHMYYAPELAKNPDYSQMKLWGVKSLATTETDSRAAELNTALQQPNQGVPKDLYQTICLAYTNHIVEDGKIRWDEGITKAEALDMLTKVYRFADLSQCVQFEITPMTDMEDMEISSQEEEAEQPIYVSLFTEEENQMADEVYAEIIRPDMDDFERVKAIHDYVLKQVVYDKSTVYSWSIKGALENGRGVCQAYADSFRILCLKSGVECEDVGGLAGERHAWNRVKLDGEWYNVDTTWDDSEWDQPEDSKYEYFCISDSIMYRDHMPYFFEMVSEEEFPKEDAKTPISKEETIATLKEAAASGNGFPSFRISAKVGTNCNDYISECLIKAGYDYKTRVCLTALDTTENENIYYSRCKVTEENGAEVYPIVSTEEELKKELLAACESGAVTCKLYVYDTIDYQNCEKIIEKETGYHTWTRTFFQGLEGMPKFVTFVFY